MKYEVVITDTADSHIHAKILFIAEKFGNKVALEKMEYLEKSLMNLSEPPYIGVKPRYNILNRQGFLVLILKKDLVFYKVDEKRKIVTIYAVVDQRQDYLKIIRGL